MMQVSTQFLCAEVMTPPWGSPFEGGGEGVRCQFWRFGAPSAFSFSFILSNEARFEMTDGRSVALLEH